MQLTDVALSPYKWVVERERERKIEGFIAQGTKPERSKILLAKFIKKKVQNTTSLKLELGVFLNKQTIFWKFFEASM